MCLPTHAFPTFLNPGLQVVVVIVVVTVVVVVVIVVVVVVAVVVGTNILVQHSSFVHLGAAHSVCALPTLKFGFPLSAMGVWDLSVWAHECIPTHA